MPKNLSYNSEILILGWVMDIDVFIAKYKIEGAQEEELRALVDEARERGFDEGYDEGYDECRQDIENGITDDDDDEDEDWDDDFDDDDELTDKLFDDED